MTDAEREARAREVLADAWAKTGYPKSAEILAGPKTCPADGPIIRAMLAFADSEHTPTTVDAVEQMARAIGPGVFEPFDLKRHGSPANHKAAQDMHRRSAQRVLSLPFIAQAVERERVMRERIAELEALPQPWADHHGDLPEYDHPLACVFDSGVQYAVELLAKELQVDDWTHCDGTEEYDGDLGGTLINIVLASMPKDKDGDPMHPREVRAALNTTGSKSDD